VYVSQQNSGKHVAVNAGIRSARGYFIGILDSDDGYTPNAMEGCWQHWRRVPEAQRSGYVGLTALCMTQDGSLVGSRFPADVFDSDSIECHARFGISGDKKGFQRAEVLRQFPFPEDLGRFVPEGIVWNRIARRFKTRYINEVWAIVEYQKDGLSANTVSTRVKSPRAASLYYKEVLGGGQRLPLLSRIRNSANFIRFSLHAQTLEGSAAVPRQDNAGGPGKLVVAPRLRCNIRGK
jgi:glycosyltransferase involved in cell wall biosynthesis